MTHWEVFEDGGVIIRGEGMNSIIKNKQPAGSNRAS